MNVRCYQGREGYDAGQMHKLGCHGKTWANVYNHDAIMRIHSHENANADEMDACDLCIMHPIM